MKGVVVVELLGGKVMDALLVGGNVENHFPLKAPYKHAARTGTHQQTQIY